MKKHLLSITLLLAPAALFAMETEDVVSQLVKDAPVKAPGTAKGNTPLTNLPEAVVETTVQQLTAAAPADQTAAEEAKDNTEKVEAAYRRGALGSIGLALTGYNRTSYVQSYFRCDERCATHCEHKMTIPAAMIDQLTSDRNRAIMKEQTEAIASLQAKRDGTIPSQHEVQKAIHEGPVQQLGSLVRGSKQTVNFKLKDVRSVKRVDTLLRNEDAADLQLLADAYDMIQARMQERKAIRADLFAQKPAESEIVYSDTEYDNDAQFVEKLQGYRKVKKAQAAKK
jgi:hypothetical protein